ncbi:MAG: hypothetical protein Tsb0032_16700 [Kiloniellaceae bacterium]
MNLVNDMSNSDVFGSPMILTGYRPVSPFGAAPSHTLRQSLSARAGRFLAKVLRRCEAPRRDKRRIRKTVVELSKLDDRTLRDIGLDRTTIIGAAQDAEERRTRGFRSKRF